MGSEMCIRDRVSSCIIPKYIYNQLRVHLLVKVCIAAEQHLESDWKKGTFFSERLYYLGRHCQSLRSIIKCGSKRLVS